MKATLFALALVIFPLSLSAQQLSTEQVSEAVCRINVEADMINDFGLRVRGMQRGSGTVIDKRNGKYYILTNGHVVDGTTGKITVDFFSNGYKLLEVPAKLTWSRFSSMTSIDSAVIEVDAKLMKLQPRVINLAPRGTSVKNGDLIYGAGFPNGFWLQNWEARAAMDSGNTVAFNMPPVGGQSGSGILKTVNGKTCLVGIVTWRIGDERQNYGAGVSVNRLYEIMDGKAVQDKVNAKYVRVASLGDDDICNRCGRRKSEHIARPNLLGQSILYCPKCIKHGWTHRQHEEHGFLPGAFCGPNKCFPHLKGVEEEPNEAPLPPSLGGGLPPNIGEPEQVPPEVPAKPEPKEEPKVSPPAEAAPMPTPSADGVSVQTVSFLAGGALLSGLLLPWLGRKLTAKVGWLPAKLILWAGKKVVGGKIAKLEQSPIVQGIEKVAVVGFGVGKKAKDFFDLKSSDGESKNGWAFKGILYKEAVGYLRQGKLEFTPGIPLNGYVASADAIDKWVRSNFLNGVGKEKLVVMKEDDVLREATYGFLYEEAVKLLRDGKFGVLNYKETANAIENYVEEKLVSYIEEKHNG